MKKLLMIVMIVILASSVYAISDSDRDGVLDANDKCPNSGSRVVDSFGCDCKQKTEVGCKGAWCCKRNPNKCVDDCVEISRRATCTYGTDYNYCGEYRTCPEDKCRGPDLVDYPLKGHDYCERTKCVEFECEPTVDENNPECIEQENIIWVEGVVESNGGIFLNTDAGKYLLLGDFRQELSDLNGSEIDVMGNDNTVGDEKKVNVLSYELTELEDEELGPVLIVDKEKLSPETKKGLGVFIYFIITVLMIVPVLVYSWIGVSNLLITKNLVAGLPLEKEMEIKAFIARYRDRGVKYNKIKEELAKYKINKRIINHCFKDLKKKPKGMTNLHLIDLQNYILMMAKQGYDKKQILQALKQQGWLEKEMKLGMNILRRKK